ncbi:MAG: hypothetical protein HRU25_14135 [Psychrobium sp.]|nr:hypothetical protein [Psychrobium sp.]
MSPADFDLTNSTHAGAFVESIPGIASFDVELGFAGVGFNAVQALGLELIAGRDFSTTYQSDWFNQQQRTAGIIIPQSLLVAAGYQTAQQAIGQVWQFCAGPYQHVQGKIIGVIKDVKIGSARENVVPTLFVCGMAVGGVYSLVIEVVDQYSMSTKQAISDFVTQRLGVNAVEIQLVAQNYQQLYRGENKLVKMVVIFSALAVFLTCVGMFGLAAFSAQQRSNAAKKSPLEKCLVHLDYPSLLY